ncbi:MAG: alcohol dehydrogenase catalytic domain-containing protein [Planctomycetaceae bacterium]|nr:alcohol dehydrogenase catalytic domain-containing protein [Planctomycetaceae bacterium]
MEKLDNIPEKMNAVMCCGPKDYQYQQVPVPSVGEDDILVKVEACGICAGDVKSWRGAAMFWGDENQPRWNDAPCVAGHEFIGRVAAIGSRAKEKHGLNLGDRAIAEQIVPCWECRYCKGGEYWMCEEAHIHGHQKNVADGGMAEFIRFGKNDVVHKVSGDLKPEHAAMIEPLSCSVHTVSRAQIQFSDVVVIAGLGPIGLCKLQLAKLKNPKLLIAVDAKPMRLELAKELGADVAINFTEQDAVAEVMKLTNGYGCDVYIHNSGHPSGVVQGLKMVRKRGRFIEFSVFSSETSVDWSVIGDRKELDVFGSHISGLDGYPVAIDFLEKGIIKVDKIVTHVHPLANWEEAFNQAERGADSIKVVLKP